MSINVLSFIYVVNVSTFAPQLFCQPRWTTSLRFHHLLDDCSNMYIFVYMHEKSVNRL